LHVPLLPLSLFLLPSFAHMRMWTRFFFFRCAVFVGITSKRSSMESALIADSNTIPRTTLSILQTLKSKLVSAYLLCLFFFFFFFFRDQPFKLVLFFFSLPESKKP
jgi:hypothetical protein